MSASISDLDKYCNPDSLAAHQYAFCFSECGCGDADAGCKHCGACIVCNNDPIPEDHNIYPKLENLENAIVLYEEGRKRIKKIKDKAKKKSESNELLKEKTTEFRIGFEGMCTCATIW